MSIQAWVANQNLMSSHEPAETSMESEAHITCYSVFMQNSLHHF
jgi:hypothetical protein